MHDYQAQMLFYKVDKVGWNTDVKKMKRYWLGTCYLMACSKTQKKDLPLSYFQVLKMWFALAAE